MGCCSAKTSDLSFINEDNPEEWTQNMVLLWLQYSCNGELSDLIKPFSEERISGLSFIKLTSDDLKRFGINQIGLREQYIHERDKIITNYKKSSILTDIDNENKNMMKSTENNPECLQSHHIQLNSITFYSDNYDGDTTPNNHNNHKEKVKLIENNTDDEKSVIFDEIDQEQESEERDIDIIPSTDNLLVDLNTNNNKNGDQLSAPQSASIDSNISIANNRDSMVSMASNATVRSSILNISGFNTPKIYTPTTDFAANSYRKATDYIAQSSPHKLVSAAPIKQSIQSIQPKQSKQSIASKHWISMDSNDIQRQYIIHNVLSDIDNSLYDEINDFYELQQYNNYAYIDYSKIVIEQFLRINEMILNEIYGDKYNNSPIIIPSNVNTLCYEYYYEEQVHILQFGYDIYLILQNIEQSRNIDNEWIASFNGDQLLNEIKKKYKTKYIENNVQKQCKDLLRYNYISLIAQSVEHSDNDEINQINEINEIIHVPDDSNLILKLLNHNNIDTVNNFNDIISSNFLFQFNRDKRILYDKYLNFIKYKLDRNGWCRGTVVEIYSSSMGSNWCIGEIYQVYNDGHVIVTYGDNKNGKFKKKVRIDQEDVIRSTRDFINTRNEWEIGSKIEIFSYGQNMWCKAEITDKYDDDNTDNTDNTEMEIQDVFGVTYKNEENEEYKKFVERWSADIRSIQIISKKLEKYQSGTQIKIYSNTKQCWLIGRVKGLIPGQENIVVVYGENGEWEKTVHVHSNQIQWIHQ